jgi:hypothetical protein
MHERCDRCGGLAQVHVTLQSGELFFCSGHYQQHLPKLHDIFVRIETRDSFPKQRLLSTV